MMTNSKQAQQWVEWNGGSVPVPNDTPVEVRTGEGDYRSEVPQALQWSRRPRKSAGDIIAYRVLSGQEAAELRAHAVSHNEKMNDLRDRALAARAKQ